MKIEPTRIATWAVLGAIAAAAPMIAVAHGNGFFNSGRYRADLAGGEEVPAVSTGAAGRSLMRVSHDSIRYTVGWHGLEGDVLQSHIHLGAKGTNGGVIAFLCSNLDNAPEGVPACPQAGVVSGRIDADSIVGPNGQGIAPGELDEAVRALKDGLVYVNVHSSSFPGGEIRGQVGRGIGGQGWSIDSHTPDLEELLGGEGFVELGR